MLFYYDENSTICWNIRGTSRYRDSVLRARQNLGENPRVMSRALSTRLADNQQGRKEIDCGTRQQRAETLLDQIHIV